MKIGDRMRNKLTGLTETITQIKHRGPHVFLNGYKSDNWEMVSEKQNTKNLITDQVMWNVISGASRWNGKFYGNAVYVDGEKYFVNESQRRELARNAEVEY